MQNINKRDIVSVAIFTTILVTNPRLIIQWSCATTWFFFKSSNVKVLIVGFFNLAEKKSGLRFYEMYYFWLWQIWYILIYRLASFNLLILYLRTKARQRSRQRVSLIIWRPWVRASPRANLLNNFLINNPWTKFISEEITISTF